MLDVVEVVFELALGLLKTGAILKTHLCPTCEPGANHVSKVIERNFTGEPLDKLGALRTRPNKRHIPAQYVPKLRDLVEPCLTHEASDSSDAGVIRFCPHSSIHFRVLAHGTKLIG